MYAIEEEKNVNIAEPMNDKALSAYSATKRSEDLRRLR